MRRNYELYHLRAEPDTPVMMKLARMGRLMSDVRMDEAAVIDDSCLLNPGVTDEQSDQRCDGVLCDRRCVKWRRRAKH